MNTKDIDQRIGMPDVDAEWAKFEKEVINPTLPAKKHPFFKSWTARAAAIAGIIFLLGGAIASAVILSKPNSKLAAILTLPDNDTIYNVVEEMPIFISDNGHEEIWDFCLRNRRYPEVALKNGVYGRVAVQFVVEKDGKSTSFKIVKQATQHKKHIKRNVHPTEDVPHRDYITEDEFKTAQKALEDESIRMCRLMKWTPGKIKGKAVRTRFTLPFIFRPDGK